MLRNTNMLHEYCRKLECIAVKKSIIYFLQKGTPNIRGTHAKPGAGSTARNDVSLNYSYAFYFFFICDFY